MDSRGRSARLSDASRGARAAEPAEGVAAVAELDLEF